MSLNNESKLWSLDLVSESNFWAADLKGTLLHRVCFFVLSQNYTKKMLIALNAYRNMDRFLGNETKLWPWEFCCSGDEGIRHPTASLVMLITPSKLKTHKAKNKVKCWYSYRVSHKCGQLLAVLGENSVTNVNEFCHTVFTFPVKTATGK